MWREKGNEERQSVQSNNGPFSRMFPLCGVVGMDLDYLISLVLPVLSVTRIYISLLYLFHQYFHLLSSPPSSGNHLACRPAL